MVALRLEGKYFPLFYTLFIASGFVICFGLAVFLHWSKVVRNHCRVWEFFPSVSSVIGDHKPEMNVWRVAIALGSGPRFVSALLNYKILVDSLSSQKSLIQSALFVDLLRIGAAGGWTYISSSEYNFEHSVCFVLYVVFSLVYMGIHTPLFRKARVTSKSYPTAQLSYKWKLTCFVGHIVFFFISLYFFLVEHQKHCMPGGYSRYALCEWILSAFNILTCYLDFEGMSWVLEDHSQSTQHKKT